MTTSTTVPEGVYDATIYSISLSIRNLGAPSSERESCMLGFLTDDKTPEYPNGYRISGWFKRADLSDSYFRALVAAALPDVAPEQLEGDILRHLLKKRLSLRVQHRTGAENTVWANATDYRKLEPKPAERQRPEIDILEAPAFAGGAESDPLANVYDPFAR